jgi:adenylate kinase
VTQSVALREVGAAIGAARGAAHSSHRDGITVVLAGRPGAGKGTQAERVASQMGLVHLSTGDLVRDEVALGTTLGRALHAAVTDGRLVDDRTMLDLLARKLDDIGPRRGVLLDGYPRTVAQAAALDALRPIDLVLELDVPARRIIERLRARARDDDTAAAIDARLHVYDVETRPMLRVFDARGALVTVSGDRAPELVAADILGTLAAWRSSHRAVPVTDRS